MDKERIRKMLINSYEAGYQDRANWHKTINGQMYYNLCRKEFEEQVDELLEEIK